jgi:hypothetical protein
MWKGAVVSLYKVRYWGFLEKLGKSTKTPFYIVGFWTMNLRLELASKKLCYYRRNCDFM